MRTEFYNIHNIAKIQINKPDHCGLFGQLNREYYLYSSKPIEPNIILNIGQFQPKYNVNPKGGTCNVKNNYLFVEEHGTEISWKLEIIGWEEASFTFNFYPIVKNIRRFAWCFFLQNLFLREIIEIIMVNSGYNVVHGSAFADKNNGFVLSGEQKSYKTTLLMNLIRSGYSLMSDDKVIIKNNKLWSFAVNIPSFTFWLNHFKTEDDQILLYQARLLYWTIKGLKKNVFPISIITEKDLKTFIYLIKTKESSDKSYDNTKSNLWDAITKDAMSEWNNGYMPTFSGIKSGYFNFYFNKYIHENPNSKLYDFWDRYRKLLETNVNVKYTYQPISEGYSETIFNKLKTTLL